MNLPKYQPGVIVVIKEDTSDEKQATNYPEGLGIFVIAECFLQHEEWHYQNYDGSTQAHESEIIAVINNGYYVPAEHFQGVQEAPSQEQMLEELSGMMAKSTPEEQEFIRKHSTRPILTEKKAKKEKKDGNAK